MRQPVNRYTRCDVNNPLNGIQFPHSKSRVIIRNAFAFRYNYESVFFVDNDENSGVFDKDTDDGQKYFLN